jgi:predicted secreted protein
VKITRTSFSEHQSYGRIFRANSSNNLNNRIFYSNSDKVEQKILPSYMQKADRESYEESLESITFPESLKKNEYISGGLQSLIPIESQKSPESPESPKSPPKNLPLLLSSKIDYSSLIKSNVENEEILHYKQNQPFIIELSSNPSTGYKWKIDPLINLKIIYQGYWSTCEKGLPGCGGYEYWVIAGIKKGYTTFSAKYIRSWESSSNNIHKEIKIIIE